MTGGDELVFSDLSFSKSFFFTLLLSFPWLRRVLFRNGGSWEGWKIENHLDDVLFPHFYLVFFLLSFSFLLFVDEFRLGRFL